MHTQRVIAEEISTKIHLDINNREIKQQTLFLRRFIFFLHMPYYRGADKSLAQPTSRCILFDGENILFDANLVTYINSTNIPPIMIINRIYENQNQKYLMVKNCTQV